MLNDSGSQQISSNRETEENSAMEKSPILVDGHVDLTYFLMNLPEDIPLSGLEYGPFTLKKIREVGLRLFSNAIYCEDKFNGEASLRHLKETLQFTLSHFDEVTIIEDGQDLEGIKKEPERIGTLLLLENADGLVGNLSFIEGLMQTGIRIVGLTHRGSRVNHRKSHRGHRAASSNREDRVTWGYAAERPSRRVCWRPQ